VQNAPAVAADYPLTLPDSSYYDGCVYYDRVYYDEDSGEVEHLAGRIDFAV
jgi:hypothetical protein